MLNVAGPAVVSYNSGDLASLTIQDTGTSQAGLNIKAGSGSTNRASRINFFNNVASTSTPRWAILNDYFQNGENDFVIADSAATFFMHLTSNHVDGGAFIINDQSDNVDFRVESDSNSSQFYIDGQHGFVSIGKASQAAGTNGLHFGTAGTSAIISASGTGNTWHTYSTSTNSYNFIVGANGQVSYVSLNQLSDEREKENIVDIPVGLEAVKQLRPCQFDWKAAEQGTNVYGFIAQEVESVIPTIVSEYKKSDTETRKSIKHVDLIAVLTKAMQEQQAMIETLEARITALENA